MKKKLALLLVMVMCVSVLATGCLGGNTGDTTTGSSATESESESSTEKLVEITELYNKGKYESANMSEYVTIGSIDGIISIKESDYVVTEEEIQKEIDAYREYYGTVTEVKDRDTVKEGDIVNIDYVGRIGGIKFEGGSDTKFDLTIGSGTFIEGFESGLIGAKKGETVDVTVTFPKDYSPEPDLAGKEAVFSVTINLISVSVPAEYNDELVSKITSKTFTTVEQFNKYITIDLTLSKKGSVLNKLLVELAKNATFTEKAEELVTANYESAIKYYESYAAMYGYTFEKFAQAMGFKDAEELKSEVKKDATAEVHNELLMYAYGSAIGFELSNEAALAVLEDLTYIQASDSPEQVLTDYGVEVIRSECYSEVLVDAIINNYK